MKVGPTSSSFICCIIMCEAQADTTGAKKRMRRKHGCLGKAGEKGVLSQVNQRTKEKETREREGGKV